MKKWFKCPVCGQKLAKIDDDKDIAGVAIWCKKCKREIEIRNTPKQKINTDVVNF
ncbi:hypothetical protein IAI10_02610 [Clostridium sp. 19966]|uniref:cysteine-rich KTR domain-containing protein n=1 Tax=Clostridium sp. 19966 TaxID=2768166 RepID=UPI0028E08160|nr:cysteine-rich KTR domain-containing protein [Clostridium sp. 19966]MDT8715551.1 hypothetical protein [Clostridium sp. 19966]